MFAEFYAQSPLPADLGFPPGASDPPVVKIVSAAQDAVSA